MTTDSTLPLPDYDHVQFGQLPARISPLDAEGVQLLLDYERAHGNRLPVVTVLDHRLEALRDGATPSGTVSSPLADVSGGPGGSSKVDPATSGPKLNPPSHGNPANPAQPR